MTRVALYCRVSTEEQAKGRSLDSQRDTMRDWARAEEWNPVSEYSDPGASGRSVEHRPGFLKMIDDAEAGRFDAVLVLKLDRFARNRGDSAIYRRRLERAGVALLSYNERTDGLSRSAALLTNGLQELLAEHYSVELSEKTSAGWRKRAEKGLPAGDIPFGYLSGGPSKTPVVVVEEAEALCTAFELYAAGDASLMDVARSLNDAGFAPRSKRGSTQFGQKTVRGMLANRFYVGDIVYKGDVIATGLHDPVIPRELFQRVQDARERRRARPTLHAAAQRTRRVYLLRGVALCSVCGGQMWANSMANGRHSYYRCASRVRGRPCTVKKTSIRADGIERYVRMLFEQWQQPEDWAERVRNRSITDDNGRADAEAKRNSIGARAARYRRATLDGLVDYAEGTAEIRRLEAELAILEPRENDNNALIASGELTDIGDLWPLMRPAEQQRLIQLALEAVVIDSDTETVVGVIPHPDFMPIFDVAAEDEDSRLGVVTWRPRADSKSPLW